MTTIWQKGFAPIKRVLPAAIWSPARGIATGILTPIRFSLRTGHLRSSLRQVACGASGFPLPWYTYPAIDFLKYRDFQHKRILEFGGGQSTLWWAARSASVLTIEEDKGWFAQLRSCVPRNVTLHHVPADSHLRSVEPIKTLLDSTEDRTFDVIVVDGHLRRELAVLAFDYLPPDGVIVLDDAEGYGLHDALKNQDCRRVDFYGFSPGVSLRHCTSLVFKGDCFLFQPDIPIVEIETVD